MDDQTFNTKEVCKIAGCSVRQLTRWSAGGVLGNKFVGTGSGHRREYTVEDLEIIKVITKVSSFIAYLSENKKTGSRGGSLSFLSYLVFWLRLNPPPGPIYISLFKNKTFNITKIPTGAEVYIKIVRN